ncbi:LysR family transcriptional regulator (plasmid) [Streptomyces sp. BI20]|uniref:LysR family transcriptional regulator n=1 Tax=Streptomyces sp. BI20 TaxID=3403460 RepID=UPI003C7533DE
MTGGTPPNEPNGPHGPRGPAGPHGPQGGPGPYEPPGSGSLVGALAPYLAQFAVVAREEHLTHAADLLGVSQPTLSRTMSRLESLLSVPLFLHVGRGIRLTPQGRRLLERAEQALALLDLAGQEIAADADAEHGLVRLAHLKSLGPRVVPALLGAFHAEHPAVRFVLTEASSPRMIELLRSGDVDLCLIAPAPDAAGIESEVLWEQELRLVVPTGHRWAGRARVALAGARDEPFVAMTREYGTRLLADALCREAGFSPRIALETDATDTVRALVAAGMGIAVLPHEGSPHPGTVDLALTRAPGGPAATRPLCLAWAGHAVRPPAATLVREFLRAHRSAPDRPNGP